MAIAALQLPQQGAINNLMDWTPLQNLVAAINQKRQEQEAADLINQLPQQQQPQAQPQAQPQPQAPQPAAPVSDVAKNYASGAFPPLRTLAPRISFRDAPTPVDRIDQSFDDVRTNGAYAPGAPQAAYDPSDSPVGGVPSPSVPWQPTYNAPITPPSVRGYVESGVKLPPPPGYAEEPQRYTPEGLDRLQSIIRQKESSGRYNLVVDTGKGHKVYGAYGVEDDNIPEWTKAALGRSMTPEEFLRDPKAQDAVAKYQLGQYADKYGLTGAGKAWFAGDKGMNNPRASDKFGTTVQAYGDDVARKLGADLPPEITAGASRPEAPQARALAFDAARHDDAQARIADNLKQPQAPAVDAGIPREQLAAMMRNPLTRPLATAYLQKMMDPNRYSFMSSGDGFFVIDKQNPNNRQFISGPKTVTKGEDDTVIRTNPDDPAHPITVAGANPLSAEERKVEGLMAAGRRLGLTGQPLIDYAKSGGKEKEGYSAKEQGLISDAEKRVTSADDVIDNIRQMRQLSPSAWSGFASDFSGMAQRYLPDAMVPQGAIDTERLKQLALLNVAAQAKATFGSRLNQSEIQILNQIETTPHMTDSARQALYDQVERMMQRHKLRDQAEADAVRGHTYFKPGYRMPEDQPLPSERAVNPAKPTLGQFMEKARAANPGVPDSELARFWKEKYGG
jgi:hypothetical protein